MAAADRFPRRRELGRAYDPELRLAASTARFTTLAALPVLGCAWLAAGIPGLLGAAIAAALATVLPWGSAILLCLLVRRRGTLLLVGVLGGFFARLAATATLLAALAPIEGINHASLALSGIVLIAAALAWESWQASHAPGFFWVTPAPAADRRSERIQS